jgi:small conductance mechanosensitive channel
MDQQIFQSINDLFERLINNISQWLSDHGFEIALIIIGALLIHRFGSQFLARVMEKTARRDLYPTKSDRIKRLATLENLAGDMLKIGVTIVAGLMIISELGINTAPLLASAGVVGLVIGIGAQGLVRDVASGFFIIVNNQYRVGDEIELRIGGAMSLIEGTVEDIGVRSTSVRDLDGSLHHIPNGNIMVATNQTIGFSRLNLDITFPKSIDITKLQMLINRIGEDLDNDPVYAKMVKKPPQFVRVVGFTDEGVTVKILGKTGSIYSDEVSGEFLKRLIKELKKAKMPLPIG